MNIDSVFNHGLFDVYLGLTASGYDLANPDRSAALQKRIAVGDWSTSVLDYFSFARINDGRINPYWPRGSILASVGLLFNASPLEKRLALVDNYIGKLTNLSPGETDYTTALWAAALNEHVSTLRMNSVYPEVLARYQQIIETEIREYSLRYEPEILAARHRLSTFLPPHSSMQRLVTILNPLQADPLTDIVASDDTMYVITSHLRADSFVHEMIHILLEPYIDSWKERIARDAILLDSVYQPLHGHMYAWDRSAASWINVFTETLVRALTIVATGNAGQEGQVSQVDALIQESFRYARPMVELINANPEQPLSEEWLENCLLACRREAESRTCC